MYLVPNNGISPENGKLDRCLSTSIPSACLTASSATVVLGTRGSRLRVPHKNGTLIPDLNLSVFRQMHLASLRLDIGSSIHSAYLIGLFAWVLSLWLRYDGIPLKRLFHDRQPVQHLQEAHLVLASLLVAVAVILLLRSDRASAWLAIIAGSILLWSANRELDGVWKRFDLEWIYYSLQCLSVIPGVLVLAFQHRECWIRWRDVCLTPPFLLLYVAGAGYILGQLLGHLMGLLEFERHDKRALQESIELLSSALALFASFEILGLARRAMNVSLPEIEGQEVSRRG